MTAAQFDLSAYANRFHNIPYIISEKGRLTYGLFLTQVRQAIVILNDAGVQHGDRVIIAGPSDMLFPVWLFALMQTGAVAVPINPDLPAPAMNNMISRITGRHIIISRKKIKDLEFRQTGFIDYDLVLFSLEQKPQSDVMLHPVPLEQQATIIFTSGSTSNPNAVLHTAANHYFSALGANENIPLGVGDRWLLSLPVYHVGGLAVLFRTIISGASVVIPGAGLSTGQNIEKFNITHLSLVAAQLSRLLNESVSFKKFRQIKSVLIGGGPVVKDLITQARENGLPVYTSYGSTEMASQITTTLPGDELSRQHTSGRLLDFRELRISGNGEIEVRGKTLFAGYIDGTDLQRQMSEDGWFRTGDLGCLDQDGYLTVTGRKDNMFISGGENIFPEELEQVLIQTGAVEQVLVVAVPHAEFGNQAVAIIKSKEGLVFDEQGLKSELKKILPGFKIPKIFLQWPEKSPDGLKPGREWFKTYARQQVKLK